VSDAKRWTPAALVREVLGRREEALPRPPESNQEIVTSSVDVMLRRERAGHVARFLAWGLVTLVLLAYLSLRICGLVGKPLPVPPLPWPFPDSPGGSGPYYGLIFLYVGLKVYQFAWRRVLRWVLRGERREEVVEQVRGRSPAVASSVAPALLLVLLPAPAMGYKYLHPGMVWFAIVAATVWVGIASWVEARRIRRLLLKPDIAYPWA